MKYAAIAIAIKFKRLFRRLRCKHPNYVWLREWSNPRGGTYPVKCYLDCGKLTWAVITVCGPVRYTRFLKPEGVTYSSRIPDPKFVPVRVDSFVPPTANGSKEIDK